MAVLINIDECIFCGMCFLECPSHAIAQNKDWFFEIIPEKCDECIDLPEGPRCIMVCPVTCIYKHD